MMILIFAFLLSKVIRCCSQVLRFIDILYVLLEFHLTFHMTAMVANAVKTPIYKLTIEIFF